MKVSQKILTIDSNTRKPVDVRSLYEDTSWDNRTVSREHLAEAILNNPGYYEYLMETLKDAFRFHESVRGSHASDVVMFQLKSEEVWK